MIPTDILVCRYMGIDVLLKHVYLINSQHVSHVTLNKQQYNIACA